MKRFITAVLATSAALAALSDSAPAATETNSPNAPTNFVVGQGDDSNGPNGANSYSDGSPPAQSFTAPYTFLLTSITVQGTGSNSTPRGTGVWDIEVGRLNGTGTTNGTTITPLDTETAPLIPADLPANTANYFTFTLANPVQLVAGGLYEYTIHTGNDDNFYFGFAGSTNDVYPGGAAFSNGTTQFQDGDVVANTSDFDRTFFLVPEPSTIAASLLGVGGLFAVSLRRRRALA